MARLYTEILSGAYLVALPGQVEVGPSRRTSGLLAAFHRGLRRALRLLCGNPTYVGVVTEARLALPSSELQTQREAKLVVTGQRLT